MASPTDVMNGDQVLPAARLRELARGVQLLLPDRRDPHLFHEMKSSLVADLHALACGLDGHRPVRFHIGDPIVIRDSHVSKSPDQLRLSVVTPELLSKGPPGIGRLPPLGTNCLHCRRRRASQGRRQRLRLPAMTLFDWAEQCRPS
jgi:hypothetical protein